MKVSVNCFHCKKIFFKNSCDLKKGYNNFCSRLCYKINRKSKIEKCFSCNCVIDRSKRPHYKDMCNTCYVNNHRKKVREMTPYSYKRRKNGDGTITVYGYKQISIPNHPNSRKNGQIFEHIYVMSSHLKRPIKKSESVHHKNGDKLDNRIENLELWNKSHPYGQRVEDKIKFYKEFLESYGYKVTKKGE